MIFNGKAILDSLRSKPKPIEIPCPSELDSLKREPISCTLTNSEVEKIVGKRAAEKLLDKQISIHKIVPNCGTQWGPLLFAMIATYKDYRMIIRYETEDDSRFLFVDHVVDKNGVDMGLQCDMFYANTGPGREKRVFETLDNGIEWVENKYIYQPLEELYKTGLKIEVITEPKNIEATSEFKVEGKWFTIYFDSYTGDITYLLSAGQFSVATGRFYNKGDIVQILEPVTSEKICDAIKVLDKIKVGEIEKEIPEMIRHNYLVGNQEVNCEMKIRKSEWLRWNDGEKNRQTVFIHNIKLQLKKEFDQPMELVMTEKCHSKKEESHYTGTKKWIGTWKEMIEKAKEILQEFDQMYLHKDKIQE